MTARDVFEIAMALSDNLSSAGASEHSDTAEYLNRTVHIINSLQPELYVISDTKTASAGGRPVGPLITGLDEPLCIDEGLARTVLPNGLISRLFADENPVLADLYLQLYEEGKKNFRALPAQIEPVADIYGGLSEMR